MKSITSIDKFKEGESIQGFYLCFEKHISHNRNGDLYIDLRLRDKSGSINAKIWDNVKVLNQKFESGDPVAISGDVESFMERPHLIIKKININTNECMSRFLSSVRWLIKPFSLSLFVIIFFFLFLHQLT